MILRKETGTHCKLTHHDKLCCRYIRMNNTPQGDGNLHLFYIRKSATEIRMNNTP